MTDEEMDWESLPCPCCDGERWVDLVDLGTVPCDECNDEDPPLPRLPAGTPYQE